MDCMRELYTTRERVRKLEIENIKLMAERDTLRYVLHLRLSIILHIISSDVLNQKPTVIRYPVPSIPTRVTHANIKFWTIEDFEKWLLTPEGQAANRGKEPFLEEENGDPVSDQRVSDIKACMRSAFCELVNMKRAPQVWGEIDTTGRQTFHSLMEKSYPLFRCAENGWKLDRLARSTYPAWRRFHLDENMNWKSSDERKLCLKRKNTGEESLVPTKLQRCIYSIQLVNVTEILFTADLEFSNAVHRGGAQSSESGPPLKGDPDTQQELKLALSAHGSNETLLMTKHVKPLYAIFYDIYMQVCH